MNVMTAAVAEAEDMEETEAAAVGDGLDMTRQAQLIGAARAVAEAEEDTVPEEDPELWGKNTAQAVAEAEEDTAHPEGMPTDTGVAEAEDTAIQDVGAVDHMPQEVPVPQKAAMESLLSRWYCEAI